MGLALLLPNFSCHTVKRS